MKSTNYGSIMYKLPLLHWGVNLHYVRILGLHVKGRRRGAKGTARHLGWPPAAWYRGRCFVAQKASHPHGQHGEEPCLRASAAALRAGGAASCRREPPSQASWSQWPFASPIHVLPCNIPSQSYSSPLTPVKLSRQPPQAVLSAPRSPRLSLEDPCAAQPVHHSLGSTSGRSRSTHQASRTYMSPRRQAAHRHQSSTTARSHPGTRTK